MATNKHNMQGNAGEKWCEHLEDSSQEFKKVWLDLVVVHRTWELTIYVSDVVNKNYEFD